MLWDDKNLYVLFEVKDPDVVGLHRRRNRRRTTGPSTGQPKLWTKDTVEMMVDPDPSRRQQGLLRAPDQPAEQGLQVAVRHLQQPKTGPNGPFGHEDWDPKLKSAVVVKGTTDKPDRATPSRRPSRGPAYAKAANHPPKPGDVWRINFYAMKNNGGVAWSPILGQGNFHKAWRHGT
jgi:hypothetical protein